jgi:hypothetical protein
MNVAQPMRCSVVDAMRDRNNSRNAKLRLSTSAWCSQATLS